MPGRGADAPRASATLHSDSILAALAPFTAVVHSDAASAQIEGNVAPSASKPSVAFVQGSSPLASAREGAVAWTNRLLTRLLPQHRHLMAGLREQGRSQ